MSQPAAFIDRDGVLNHRIPGDTYVTCPEELEVLPHAVEGLLALQERGYVLVVVTNQRGVARGFLTEEDLTRIHAKLRAACDAGGVSLAGVYHCPHDRDDGCACRKPQPGMLLRAAAELDLDLSRSLLVGDSPRDLEAAERAGVPLRLLIPSDGDLRTVLDQVPDLREARR